MKQWAREALQAARVAHLGTVDPGGEPHLIPIVFAIQEDRLFSPLDRKPKGVPPLSLQRVRNIESHAGVAVLVDYYSEQWDELFWVLLRGRAHVLGSGADYETGRGLLEAKYPQYRQLSLRGCPLILVEVEKASCWRAGRQPE